MNAAKQNKLLKYILIGCAAVILILSVVLCVTAAKNKDLKSGGQCVEAVSESDAAACKSGQRKRPFAKDDLSDIR